MEAFDLKLESLRENGIGLGLDDKEIDCCMIEALRDAKRRLSPAVPRTAEKGKSRPKTTEERRPAKKSTLRKLYKICRNICLFVVFLFVIVAIFNLLVENVPMLQYYAGRYLEPIFSDCIWYWRLAVLPLARTFDLTGYYAQQCLVMNPFRAPPEVDCKEYSVISDISSLQDMTKAEFELNYLGTVKAFVLKGSQRTVPYTSLRTWYRDHEDFFSKVPTTLDSSSKTFPDAWCLSHLLANNTGAEIKAKPDFHATWMASSVNPSRLLRQLFRRPSFVPSTSEVILIKMLFIDSPGAQPYDPLSVSVEPLHNVWYVQGSGTRKILLTPNIGCQREAVPLSVTMEPGDLLYVHTPYWNMRSDPVKDAANTDVSVGFVGSFVV